MFNLCGVFAEFLIKHRPLYYFLLIFWGCLTTLFGIFITAGVAFLKLIGMPVEFIPYHWIFLVKVGPEHWGGMTAGFMFIRDHKSSDPYINPHEFGHTFQECLLGPLFPFLVAGFSSIRYWYQKLRKKHHKPNKDYDAIWFEDSATQIGDYAVEFLRILAAIRR